MTVSETATKIKSTIQKLTELQAVKRHYDSTVEELDSILENKDRIENDMIKELKDINNLEKLGVKSIFYKVLGNKEDQLEKERQEYLQVTLQHKEILNAIEVVEFEKNILEKKLIEMDQLENELQTLKEVRSKEIMSSPSPLRNELALLFKKIDNNQKYDIELKEAIEVAEKTLASMSSIYKYMEKAKDWGKWDMVNNKGRRFHKSLKHDSIDRAMHELSRTKLLLRTLNKELSDIGYSDQSLALNIENIGRFPGMIFDNLISDWIIQNKIKNVLSITGNLMDDIQQILESMLKEIRANEDDLENLEEQKHKLLEEN